MPQEEMFTCPNCRNQVPMTETRTLSIDGTRLCENCTARCEDCGDIIRDTEAAFVAGDRIVCDSCAEEYRECDDCRNLVYCDDMNELCIIENGQERYLDVCDYCLNSNHPNAEWDDEREMYIEQTNNTWPTGAVMNSDRIFQQYLDMEQSRLRCPLCMNSDEPCAECKERRAKQAKKEETTLWVYDTAHCSYHTSDHSRFKSLFYREKHEHPYLYYGIELEVLFGNDADKVKVVADFIQATNGLFVSEYDRSVDNLGNGAEFISRPTSYKRWMSPETRKLLEAGFAILKEAGAKVDQPVGCGLHVHLSRTFFEHNTKKDVNAIKSDMDWFFQAFQKEIEVLSDRKYTKYCISKAERAKQLTPMLTRDLGLNVTLSVNKGELPASYTNSENHHYAVVLTQNTIEVRTFKSTLDIDTLLARIQLCRALAHAARKIEMTKDTTFGDIISCKEGEELTKLVQKHKLNTNKKMTNTIEVK